MLELKGKYNTAKVFTDNIDAETISQIINLCNQQSMEKSKIRIMPDCHAGAGCTIGTTMTIEDKIVPNLVGVDIGCGMQVARIDAKEVDFEKLDQVIRKRIPSGMTIHEEPVVNDVYCHFLDHIKKWKKTMKPFTTMLMQIIGFLEKVRYLLKKRKYWLFQSICVMVFFSAKEKEMRTGIIQHHMEPAGLCPEDKQKNRFPWLNFKNPWRVFLLPVYAKLL